MTKITLDMKYELGEFDEPGRYVLEFKQGKATWFMFLDTYVMNDTKMMTSWLKSLVNEIQVKTGVR